MIATLLYMMEYSRRAIVIEKRAVYMCQYTAGTAASTEADTKEFSMLAI